MRDIIKNNIDTDKTKKYLLDISMPSPSQFLNKKVKGIERDNLHLSDTKTNSSNSTEYKCTFDGCVRTFKTE